MNNNSIQIERYLLNEMSATEKTAFEDQLAKDETLQQELNIQQQIMHAAINAGIKNEFAKAMHKKPALVKPLTWLILAAASILVIVLFNFRHAIFPGNDVEQHTIVQVLQPFINPPLPSANLPFIEYSINAEKADTIFYPSGSVICFPPASMVDESGNPVKGNVKVSYREFADPLDFFVSGIPMAYDSAGVKYNFESSGMCEIHAYKDNKPVFVNQHAKPAINLASYNKSTLHNLYFLDTANRKWEYTGKDIVTELKKIDKLNPASIVSLEKTDLPIKPVKPARASDDNPAFSIEIEPGSFEELFAYNNLKFEVMDQSNYKRSDADEHWDNVQLAHTDVAGIYTVTFTNAIRKVSYKVRPVLEGADYDAALNIFNEKNNAYEQALKNRIAKDQVLTDSIVSIKKAWADKMKTENDWEEKINKLIIESNKKMRALRQSKLDSFEKASEGNKQNFAIQMEIIEMNEQRHPSDAGITNKIMRSFEISGFGVWNCDHPQYATEVPLFAKFTDSLQMPVNFSSVSVVYAGFNGITNFATQQIRIMPGKENMIWAILDKTFFYFSYKDFAKAGINGNIKSFTFRMRQAKKEISSYAEIRQSIGNL